MKIVQHISRLFVSSFGNRSILSCRIIKKFLIIPFLIFVIIQGINENSFLCSASTSISDGSYIGAVVEFAPDLWNKFEKPEVIILKNAKRYDNIIRQAGKERVDIIVFPEDGLTTIEMPLIRNKLIEFASFIPKVKDGLVLCDNKNSEISEHLKLLSCSAIRDNIYVVFNLLEKKKCDKIKPDCPADGLLLYNTNVVFNRNGKIIAKYRKFNLFVEPEINVTSSAQLVTFDTDFGVRFGMFICFDLMFYEPAIKIIEDKNVNNIVYSTAWFSELPHLAAVGVQSGYSYSRNINFLASGYSRPELYNSGSGIYSGKNGPLVMIMPEEASTKLLIAKIPKNPEQIVKKSNCLVNDQTCEIPTVKIIDFNDNTDKFASAKSTDGLKFFQENLKDFVTKSLDTEYEIDNEVSKINAKKMSFKYSKDGFVCKIKVGWEEENEGNDNKAKDDKPFYRLIGFSGERNYARVLDVKIEVCSLIACKDESLSSCGLRPNFNSKPFVNITSLNIEIQSTINSNPYAVTLKKNMLPLTGNELTFKTHKDVYYSANMILEKPLNDIITFGIYKT